MSETIQAVCAHCGAINRLPTDRSAAAANCGACKDRLFDGHPAPADGAALERHLAKGDLPVLVDVWAPWCGPCRAMAPQFERAAQVLEPHVRLLKVNADQEPALSQRYGIRGIPTLLLFAGGKLIGQTAGAMDANRIVDWTRSQLAQAVI